VPNYNFIFGKTLTLQTRTSNIEKQTSKQMNKQTIRPILTFEIEAQTDIEKFQNEVLRPILKMQNDLLVQIFKHYCEKRKGIFDKLSDKDKSIYIEQAIKKDMKFKHYLEGIITGMFTLEEYQNFMENEDELTKRMVNMLVQRIQSEIKG
jgi:hypothetical protein